jgi:hypothetical protein
MKVERDIDAYYAAMFMQDKIGGGVRRRRLGSHRARPIGELPRVFVEGMIPAEELGD